MTNKSKERRDNCLVPDYDESRMLWKAEFNDLRGHRMAWENRFGDRPANHIPTDQLEAAMKIHLPDRHNESLPTVTSYGFYHSKDGYHIVTYEHDVASNTHKIVAISDPEMKHSTANRLLGMVKEQMARGKI
jgi:hypothetical protein